MDNEIVREARPVGEVEWEQYRPQVDLSGTNKTAPMVELPEPLDSTMNLLVSKDKGHLHPWMDPRGVSGPVTVSINERGGVSGTVYHTNLSHGTRYNWNAAAPHEPRDTQPAWRFVERDQAQVFGLHECKTCRRGLVASEASKDGIVVRSISDAGVSVIVNGKTHYLKVGQVLKNGSVIMLPEEICDDLGIERPSEDE